MDPTGELTLVRWSVMRFLSRCGRASSSFVFEVVVRREERSGEALTIARVQVEDHGQQATNEADEVRKMPQIVGSGSLV